MRRKTKRLHNRCLLIAAISLPAALHAQLGVYGGLTASRWAHNAISVTGAGANLVTVTTPETAWSYGPTFGIYADFPTPVVSIGADIRGSWVNGNGEHHWSGVLGPRVSIHPPVIPFSVYVEGLGGFGGYRSDPSTITTTRVDYQGVIGIDHKILPLLSWRVLEFTYAGSNYGSGGPLRAFSSGIVLRIP